MKERLIEINGLWLLASLGISREEQSVPQQIACDLRFAAEFQPEDLQEELSNTIDYALVSQRAKAIVQQYPRRLIETLAEELALQLLQEFSMRWIEITIRKFILPNADSVAVTIRKEKKRSDAL